MIDRKVFFDRIRREPFGGPLTQKQVDGITLILDEWEARGLTERRWLAYMLATTFHETGRTMQPIRERGNGDGPDADRWDDYLERYDKRTDLGHTPEADGDHVPFVGKGYVQITGRTNYKKMGDILGIDLVGHPDKALEPAIATKILFEGMLRGTFTGKRLEDYFGPAVADWRNARRIVNALDKAEQIAVYGRAFFAAMTEAVGTSPTPRPPEAPPVAPQPRPAPPQPPAPPRPPVSQPRPGSDAPMQETSPPRDDGSVGWLIAAVGAAIATFVLVKFPKAIWSGLKWTGRKIKALWVWGRQ